MTKIIEKPFELILNNGEILFAVTSENDGHQYGWCYASKKDTGFYSKIPVNKWACVHEKSNDLGEIFHTRKSLKSSGLIG